MDSIDSLKATLMAEIDAAEDSGALENVRVTALGKKGRITALMKGLGGMDPEERKQAGQAFNALKDEIAAALERRAKALKTAELDARLAAETVDMSLPVRPEAMGAIHPISQTVDALTVIFAEMGFTVADGPDIEDDFHNFTALNIPENHPARQMHDTFYLPDEDRPTEPGKVLRTHTSPVQVRHMQSDTPPLRIIAPGRVYRADSDATHSPMFHQIEGLAIDKNIHMGHLKGCLTDFCKAFFEVSEVPMRFRPSYFPFTEPSVEIDILASRKGGEFRVGADGDMWLEILGAGMVHPNVLRNCGIDPDEYQGFAFGLGVERVAMLKYGIPDIRSFYEADLRWLRHYGFAALDIPNAALMAGSAS